MSNNNLKTPFAPTATRLPIAPEHKYELMTLANRSLIKNSIHYKLTRDWEREVPRQFKTRKYLSYEVIKTNDVEDKLVERALTLYPTGSSHRGMVNRLSFSGFGVYHYPHGVVYNGQFKNGHFHGMGTLIYPNGQQIDGTWRKGRLKKWVYKFADGLEHHKEWDYLKLPDRAYASEEEYGFKAPGEELITDKKCDLQVPANSYYAGDEGYYDDTKLVIFSKDGKMKRIVDADENDFIRNYYKHESDKPVKYRPDYYEYWCSGRDEEVRRIERSFALKTVPLQQNSDDTSSTLSNIIYSIY